MARDISVIYTSIIDTKNTRDELNGLNSNSQVAIYKLWAYIVSVAIFTHELLWDLFRDEIDETLTSRINGTTYWYAQKALDYQDGDELKVLGGGTYLGYDPIIEESKIVTRCAFDDSGGTLDLKLAKGDVGSLSKLTDGERDGVESYFDKIKFAGTDINIISVQGDEIRIDGVTVYHDGVRSDADIASDVEVAMDDFLVNLDFNGIFYVEYFRDAVQQVENVVDVNIAQISLDSFETGSAVILPITRRISLYSGYAKIHDHTELTVTIENAI